MFTFVGSITIRFFTTIGRISKFFASVAYWMVRPPYRFRDLLKQIEYIGVQSLPVIVLTGFAIGIVLAVQGYITLSRFGTTYVTGGLIAVGLTRELGPVLAGIMITSRCGSAMAAQISTMKATEQIDALSTMAISPVQYLVVPRVIAAVLVLPVMNSLTIVCAIFSGRTISTVFFGVNDYYYDYYSKLLFYFDDYLNGVYKAIVFGFLIAFIACYKGYYSIPNAEGVKKATTGAVVATSVSILIADAFLTLMLY